MTVRARNLALSCKRALIRGFKSSFDLAWGRAEALAVSGVASLELCIIPFEAAVPVFPLSGFRLYDD
jgi:hypothetical protein